VAGNGGIRNGHDGPLSAGRPASRRSPSHE
jgi:hypothetical protein